MASVWYDAGNSNFEQFTAAFPGEGPVDYDVLIQALSNGDVEARVAISEWLLDRGAKPSRVGVRNAATAAHVLVDQAWHDFELEAPLLRRLLDLGVDVNAVAPRSGTALQLLSGKFKYSDEELSPFYDVFFERPDLDLLKPGWRGFSTLQLARNAEDSRALLVTRMEQYLTDRGIAVPEREV